MSNLIPGNIVLWKNTNWILIDIPDLNTALLKNPQTKQTKLVKVHELQITDHTKSKNLISIPDATWNKAWKCFQLLKPLMGKEKRECSYEEIDRVARLLGKSRSTVYRWLNKLNNNKSVSSLLRNKRSDIGSSRLSEEIEIIIKTKIESFYLTKERPNMTELWEQIAIKCHENNYPVPSQSTIKRRLNSIQDSIIIAKRHSHKLARENYEPIKGNFPDANIPLSVYQIDHTPIDIILVDDELRQPIGRAYLTIVIDTCTRMLAGFYVSFEAPSALSAGLAISHAILPKEQWLANFNIDTEWPIYGIPGKIYADNAKEFRGTMLERACQEYGIILENRPKGLPNYGGHVERSFRTFMTRTHSLPGTTFSNVQEKGEYNSESKSSMTLNEFEHWFGIFITKVYHQKKHKGIGNIPPIKLYESFILGDDQKRGIGLPAPIQNTRKLRFDFMPYTLRTIQEYGVVIDNIHYYADVLRPWIHARDPENSKLKRKFIFTKDPRDISVVYFYDPDTKTYYDIPYRNLTYPPMSQWELNSILKRISEKPELQPNEQLIFNGLKEMRTIEKQSIKTTKSARRNNQRRKNWKKKDTKVSPPKNIDIDTKNIKPFSDIVEAK